MAVDARAGKLADSGQLANIPRLVASYYALTPDPAALSYPAMGGCAPEIY